MTAGSQGKGGVAHRDRGGGLAGVWILLLCLAAAWVGGCQRSEATATVPVGQQERAVAVSEPTAGQEPQPTAREVPAEVAKPVAGNVRGRQPQITFEKDTCDLGEVGIDSKLTGEFKFTNTGNALLKIIRVQGCCGVSLKGVDPGEQYAPGQSGVLEFDYRALSIPNPEVKRLVYVETNDPDHKILSLTIKAAVVRRVDFKPEVLKLVLDKSNAGCPDLTLTSLDGRPFAVTGFEATANTMSVEFDPAVKATRFVLKPKVDMAKLEQSLRGRISINVTHPECNNVELVYETLPEFDISTSQIMMFNLKPGQAKEREFSIAGNYQDDFEIESVSSKKGTIRLLEKTKTGRGFKLRVEVIPPPHKRDEIVTSDTLEIKIKDGKTLTLQFRGFYQD